MPTAPAGSAPIVDGWIRDACAEPVDDGYRGKRQHPRYRWAIPFEIRLDGKIHNGRGLNLSTRGLCFIWREYTIAGVVLEIRKYGEEPWVPVRVEHCTDTLGGYKIGASFCHLDG